NQSTTLIRTRSRFLPASALTRTNLKVMRTRTPCGSRRSPINLRSLFFSVRIAGLAHDLGEVAMDRDYLRRPGPLSEDERIDLARHPLISEREAAHAGADRGAQLLVRWHHEWWNGTGYPDGLRFEQIPLGARILRVADAYASLTDA